jgi:hypothetical protein
VAWLTPGSGWCSASTSTPAVGRDYLAGSGEEKFRAGDALDCLAGLVRLIRAGRPPAVDAVWASPPLPAL